MADVARKADIVFIPCDNVGWGEFEIYGGATPTPRADQFTDESIRFDNDTVEAQCTPPNVITGETFGYEACRRSDATG